MFKKILIANRGEIACRVIKTAKKMGISTVAVYSDADVNALHTQMADESIYIGASPSSQSYLQIEKIIDACKATKAEAVHPGYGFLSENAKFAEALAQNGIVFIGPPPNAISAMGDKITSKKIASDAGVNTVPGYMGIIETAEDAKSIAKDVGFPVMIKASAGGGGKGMRIAYNENDVEEGFQASKNEAASSFGDDRIFIEKFVERPRHIEIQIIGDKEGNCVYLGERECSIQRRNQKVIEEAPSPFIDSETRAKMGKQACDLASAVGYYSAGTVEFIVDGSKNFYFLEMNTRLQVEHPVTELITGIDLVEQMINIANGKLLPFSQSDISLKGWALESRVYAEDPYRGFMPSIGRIRRYSPPTEFANQTEVVRNDTGVYEGAEISMFYDPMIAKLCTFANDRKSAVELMKRSLDSFHIEGVEHNIGFVNAIMHDPDFESGKITTGFIDEKFPDGFKGPTFPAETVEKILAGAAAMFRISEIRQTKISGRMDNHERRVGNDFVVFLDDRKNNVVISGDEDGATVEVDGLKSYRVEGSWVPGQRKVQLIINGEIFNLIVWEAVNGLSVQTKGAVFHFNILTPRHAKLSEHMLDRSEALDNSQLICPMPGLVTDVFVSVGEDVVEGQPLCIVEAMKMENTLRSERVGRVKQILVNKGQSVSVDEAIIEFE